MLKEAQSSHTALRECTATQPLVCGSLGPFAIGSQEGAESPQKKSLRTELSTKSFYVHVRAIKRD